jgi:hypothetical protein
MTHVAVELKHHMSKKKMHVAPFALCGVFNFFSVIVLLAYLLLLAFSRCTAVFISLPQSTVGGCSINFKHVPA